MVKVRDLPIPSPKELIYFVSMVPSKRTRALISLLYLTGGRINEVVRKISYRDITFPNDLTYYGEECYQITMPNEKNPTKKIKTQLIQMKFTIEKALMPIFIDYAEAVMLKNKGRSPSPEALPIFKISDRRVRDILKRTGIKEFGFPHIFRHYRATHLVSPRCEYHMSSYQLQKFMGWSSSIPAEWYVHLCNEDMKLEGHIIKKPMEPL